MAKSSRLQSDVQTVLTKNLESLADRHDLYVEDASGAEAGVGLYDLMSSIDDLPIAMKIAIAKNLVFNRGGSFRSIPQDPSLVAAVEILNDVLIVLSKRPDLALISKASLDQTEPC